MQLAEFKDQAKVLVQTFTERLNSEKLSTKLLAIPALLRFPPELISGVIPTIEAALKSNVSTLNEKIYYQAVCALQPAFVLKFRDSYLNILRELSLQYPNHHRKLSFPELIELLEQFVRLKVHNT